MCVYISDSKCGSMDKISIKKKRLGHVTSHSFFSLFFFRGDRKILSILGGRGNFFLFLQK